MANAKTQAYLANLKKTWPLDASPVTAKPVAQPAMTTPKPITTQPVAKPVQQQAQNTVKTITPVTPTPVPAQQGITTKNLDWSPTSIKLDMPSIIAPKTWNMFNADWSKYVPWPNSTMNPSKIQDTTQTTPVKTTTKKPLDAWLSPDGIDYQAQDQARLNEIQANLTNYSQTSPEMFKTRDAYEANFKYGERSDEQKKVLDNFYKEYQLKQGNPDFVYQTLMNWGSIDPKYQNSAWFQQGYQKYQKIGMFGSMDAKQLATQLGKKIIVWSTEWQELSKINPQLAQDALQEKKKLDAERSLNGTYADMTGIEEWRIQEVDVVTEALTKLYDKLWSLNIDIAEEYKKNVLENPVINDRYVAMEQRASKIAELQSIRDRAIDDAYASAWWAPDSVIRARANMQYRALNNQISLMQSDQEIDQAMLDTDIKRFEGMYNAKIDEYNQEIAQFQEQAKYVTGIAETVAWTLADQRVVKQEQEAQRIQNEHDMAVKQAEQEYQMTRDDQAYARQVQLANIKYSQDLQTLQLKSNLDLESAMTLAQQKAWFEWKWTVGNTTVQTNPQSIVDFSVQNRWGRTNLQCGELVNDYIYKITWANPTWNNRLWNTLDSKLTAIKTIGQSATPVVWGIFVSNPLGNNIWHTGIVQSVNEDWSITVLEANASGNSTWEAPTLRTYNNTSWMTFSQAPLNKQTQVQADSIKKDYDTIKSIIDNKKYRFVSGNIQSKWIDNMFWFNTSETVSSLRQILESKTLQTLIDAKANGATFGALSEWELRLLQASASDIMGASRKDKDWNIVWFNLSESEMKKRLKSLLEWYQKAYWEISWNTLWDIDINDTKQSKTTGAWSVDRLWLWI